MISQTLGGRSIHGGTRTLGEQDHLTEFFRCPTLALHLHLHLFHIYLPSCNLP